MEPLIIIVGLFLVSVIFHIYILFKMNPTRVEYRRLKPIVAKVTHTTNKTLDKYSMYRKKYKTLSVYYFISIAFVSVTSITVLGLIPYVWLMQTLIIFLILYITYSFVSYALDL